MANEQNIVAQLVELQPIVDALVGASLSTRRRLAAHIAGLPSLPAIEGTLMTKVVIGLGLAHTNNGTHFSSPIPPGTYSTCVWNDLVWVSRAVGIEIEVEKIPILQ